MSYRHRPWLRSPDPEVFGDGEWEVEKIVSEEVDTLGKTRYASIIHYLTACIHDMASLTGMRLNGAIGLVKTGPTPLGSRIWSQKRPLELTPAWRIGRIL